MSSKRKLIEMIRELDEQRSNELCRVLKLKEERAEKNTEICGLRNKLTNSRMECNNMRREFKKLIPIFFPTREIVVFDPID